MSARAAVTLALVAAIGQGCRRGGPTTVAEAQALVDQAVAAHGGRENLAHLQDLKVVSVGRFKDHMDFRRTLNLRAPSTWSMQIEALGGIAMAFGVDGERCWRKARQLSWSCSPADRKEYDRITDVLDARLLLFDDHDLRPGGTVDVGGVSAPAVRAGELLLAFDPTTHRLVQSRYDDGWVESFTDDRLVAGAHVFAKRTLTINGQLDVEETWETITPGGADAEALRGPPLMEAGVRVDEVDPERSVAWTEIDDLQAGSTREAIDALTRFVESKRRRPSQSDGVILTDLSDADRGPGRRRWRVAVGVEAGAPIAGLAEGEFHLETWPAGRVVGLFVRGDPRTAGESRAAVERYMDSAGLVPAPHAQWQVLYPPTTGGVDPSAGRLCLLRIVVAPR